MGQIPHHRRSFVLGEVDPALNVRQQGPADNLLEDQIEAVLLLEEFNQLDDVGVTLTVVERFHFLEDTITAVARYFVDYLSKVRKPSATDSILLRLRIDIGRPAVRLDWKLNSGQRQFTLTAYSTSVQMLTHVWTEAYAPCPRNSPVSLYNSVNNNKNQRHHLMSTS